MTAGFSGVQTSSRYCQWCRSCSLLQTLDTEVGCSGHGDIGPWFFFLCQMINLSARNIYSYYTARNIYSCDFDFCGDDIKAFWTKELLGISLVCQATQWCFLTQVIFVLFSWSISTSFLWSSMGQAQLLLSASFHSCTHKILFICIIQTIIWWSNSNPEDNSL